MFIEPRIIPQRASIHNSRQSGFQELASEAFFNFRHVLGGAFGHNLATGAAATGPEIDQPVRALDDLEVVLDDEHRISTVHQFHSATFSNLRMVIEMQSGGRLVQQVEGLSGIDAGQFVGQFDTLRFAT